MSEKTFDEQSHTYTIGDRRLPSVTEIIKSAGLMDIRFFDDYTRTRGQFVHSACELLDLGILDEDALDQALIQYVVAYKLFLSEARPIWTAIEEPLFDDAIGVAGKPDRLSADGVTDIKAGQPQPWHGIQLALYAMLAKKPITTIRRGLYLRGDGTYKVKIYSDRQDFDAGRAAVALFNWKTNNGVKKQ